MMTSNVYKFAGMSPRMHNPHIRRHQFRSIKDIKMKILPYIHIFHVLLGLNFQVDILILRRMVSKTVKVLVFFYTPFNSTKTLKGYHNLNLKILKKSVKGYSNEEKRKKRQ